MSDRGIAQLLVLWALLLLGMLAMSFAYGMRTEAMASRNGLDAERAYFQARTGINRAVVLLSTAAPDNVLGAVISGEEEDVSYRVVIESEAGKADVNHVGEELLKAMLRNGGLAPQEAESLGDAILDWRDGDDIVRASGAERAEYAALPEPVRPRNGYLADLRELLSVKGVTPELYRGFLARVFTVHGASSRVNINYAPVALLSALPGFTPELADAVEARRREAPFRTPDEIATFFAGTDAAETARTLFSTNASSSVYTVISRGSAATGIVRSIRCLLQTGRRGPGGTKILQWEDRVSADGESG